MRTHMRVLVDIVYDHAREIEATALAGAIEYALDHATAANLFDCTTREFTTLATPVSITASVGRAYPEGATERIGGTVVLRDEQGWDEIG